MPTNPNARYVKTDTPGVYRRGRGYVVGWRENGTRKWRRFPSYDAACAFQRDYVHPFRERRALPPTISAPKGVRGRGFVYFVQSKGPDGYVKVGWSQDVSRRIGDLSTAHPYGVDLIALLPGSRSLEARIHARFNHLRLGREWFSPRVLDEFVGLISVASGAEIGNSREKSA